MTYYLRSLWAFLSVTPVLILLGMLCPCSSYADTDIGWPRQVTANGNTLVYYQPQIDRWKDYSVLEGNVAFSLTPKGKGEVHGVASVSCKTIVDKENHTVYLNHIVISDVRFPSLSGDQKVQAEVLMRSLFPVEGETISVERIMADMKNKEAETQGVTLKNDPPLILYRDHPAVLLLVQGEPVWAPVGKTGLQFLVNVNWDVFYYKSKQQYYLLSGDAWYVSASLKGPWNYTKELPKDMSRLPSGEHFDDVKKKVPAPANGHPEEVLFSDEPAELLLTKGAPVYTRIAGTTLLYVSNTENDLFLNDEGSDRRFYTLLSGRWFSAEGLQGPWSYAGDKLPSGFAHIPPGSEKAHVLASVPGTTEASDAVMLAQIPSSVMINKAEAAAKVKVIYDGGTARFEPIKGTDMQYATNTQDKVIKAGDLYYLCFQAVWFVAPAPDGPWTTATSVPDEIYTIPPSSPVYNVTYVTQKEVSETTVQSSTTAGYFGAFIIGVGIGVCIAYGTGWYYPPYMYWGAGMLYPVYRPWPCSYGAGYVYNPWTGGFAGGRRVYGPYGAAGTAAWYNPATGRYGRSASVQGIYGGRTVAQAYNPWTGGYAATSQGHNAYAQWGTSVATRNGKAIQTAHVTNANGTTAAYRTNTGQHGVIHTGPNGTVIKSNNNTFAGHDGNVYRKDASGNWRTFENGKWQQPVGGSGATRHELDKASNARQLGQQQTQRFQQMQRNGSFNRSGGFGGRRFHR